MKKFYRLEIIEDEEELIYLPKDLQKPPSEKIRICFGTKVEENFSNIHMNKRNTLSISSSLAEKLLLPSEVKSCHLFISEDTYIIGPLIGIFSAGFTPFPIRPIGKRTEFFAKLLSMQASLGVVTYVFGEQQIDWDNGIISGYYFSENKWKIINFPFPNVIYDRLPNRRTEKNPSYQKVKKKLQNDYLIPWYNPGFFNKQEIFEHLKQNKNAKMYLPETEVFTSIEQLKEMLNRWQNIYLKPMNGSSGKGIYQFTQDKDQNYYCRFHDKNGNHLLKVKNLHEFIFSRFSKRTFSQMLLQQGITLLRHDNRPLDFRVHTNKDLDGQWKVTAMAAKVAGKGSVTTHLKNGGEVKSLEEIFPEPTLLKTFQSRLERAALTLSEALESEIDGIVAEIGFDFGIDREGRVWFFEANSKPGRSIFIHPDLKKFEQLTRKMSLQFGVYLTEKSMLDDEELSYDHLL
jgi:hypothetical protein